jgi:hypothetical protein
MDLKRAHTVDPRQRAFTLSVLKMVMGGTEGGPRRCGAHGAAEPPPRACVPGGTATCTTPGISGYVPDGARPDEHSL